MRGESGVDSLRGGLDVSSGDELRYGTGGNDDSAERRGLKIIPRELPAKLTPFLSFAGLALASSRLLRVEFGSDEGVVGDSTLLRALSCCLGDFGDLLLGSGNSDKPRSRAHVSFVLTLARFAWDLGVRPFSEIPPSPSTVLLGLAVCTECARCRDGLNGGWPSSLLASDILSFFIFHANCSIVQL